MRKAVAIVLAAAASLPIMAGAQNITDAEIAAAIRAGQAKKFGDLLSTCFATPSFGDLFKEAEPAGGVKADGNYDVTVSTNAGRIAFLAADAKRLYKPFTATEVPDSLRKPAVFVVAEPKPPTQIGAYMSIASPVEKIVLKSKVNPDAVVQPSGFEAQPLEWSNLVGGTVKGTRGLATFNLNAVREMPPGDFDVVVITQAGERRCKVGAKDRARVFSAKPSS